MFHESAPFITSNFGIGNIIAEFSLKSLFFGAISLKKCSLNEQKFWCFYFEEFSSSAKNICQNYMIYAAPYFIYGQVVIQMRGNKKWFNMNYDL